MLKTYLKYHVLSIEPRRQVEQEEKKDKGFNERINGNFRFSLLKATALDIRTKSHRYGHKDGYMSH